MTAATLISRAEKHHVKTVTFTATGDGAIGTVTIGTVTGRVLITHMGAFCTTTLTSGGSPTVELGVAGNTASLIAQATATDIAANDWWIDATPAEVLAAGAIVDKMVGSNIILTVATATITAGVLDFYFRWVPLSVTGNIA